MNKYKKNTSVNKEVLAVYFPVCTLLPIHTPVLQDSDDKNQGFAGYPGIRQNLIAGY